MIVRLPRGPSFPSTTLIDKDRRVVKNHRSRASSVAPVRLHGRGSNALQSVFELRVARVVARHQRDHLTDDPFYLHVCAIKPENVAGAPERQRGQTLPCLTRSRIRRGGAASS